MAANLHIHTIWSGGSLALFESIAPAVKTGSFAGSARKASSQSTDCKPVLLFRASRSASSELWYDGKLLMREACDFKGMVGQAARRCGCGQ